MGAADTSLDAAEQPAEAGRSVVPAEAAVSLEEVKQSVPSDLQYVSLQVDGATYGGWYRVLPDGQMELLALANMRREFRPEGTATEQARGMLADFVQNGRSNARKES